MRRSSLVAYLCAGFLVGCGVNEPDEGGIKLNATVSSTRAASTEMVSRAKRTLIQQLEPLRRADNINVTPTRLEIYIEYISVVNEEGWSSDPNHNAKFIEMPVGQWVDIAGAEELTDLVSTSVTLNPEQFGFYSGIKMILSNTMRVSADIALQDTTYSLSDVTLTSGGDEYQLAYPDSFYISGDAYVDTSGDTLYTAQLPEIRIILDATGMIQASGLAQDLQPDQYYPDQWVPRDSMFGAGLSNLIAVPYVGTERPQVSRYRITWDRGWEHHIRMVTLASSDGQIECAKARVIHSPDHRIALFEQNPGVRIHTFNWMRPTCIENGDGTWRLGNDTLWLEGYTPETPDEFAVPEVVFPQWQPGSHSGQMTVGDTTITYTAEEI